MLQMTNTCSDRRLQSHAPRHTERSEVSMYALLLDPSSLASKLCQDDSMAWGHLQTLRGGKVFYK